MENEYRTPLEQEDFQVHNAAGFFERPSLQDGNYHSPEEALKVLFGYDSFRPGQKDVIDSILAGKDAFAVMPTGAGKSVCYQIPVMLLPGITEANMPPYIIFSDKTLIDMAVKVPASKGEMLNVSGVGENKYAKYGERFLSRIEECTKEYPELLQNKMEVDRHEETEVTTSKRKEPEGIEERTESSWLAEQRKKHAGAYMPWTEEEDRKLTDEFESGQFTTGDLSEIHGRPKGAIRARLKKLKLIE